MPLYQLGSQMPSLGQDVWIADTATVVADVTLGDAVSIWFGAVVRGDVMPIAIGARSNIQDNAVVHVTHHAWKTTLGAGVTVGHAATIHGATVEDFCLVGAAAVILDGAVIGTGSFVAAGALVTPGTVVPPRSLVMGRPAKVARAVDDAMYALILESADNYVRYARDYAAGCRRIG